MKPFYVLYQLGTYFNYMQPSRLRKSHRADIILHQICHQTPEYVLIPSSKQIYSGDMACYLKKGRGVIKLIQCGGVELPKGLGPSVA